MAWRQIGAQAIIWTHSDPVLRRIDGALEGDELKWLLLPGLISPRWYKQAC